MSQPVDGVVRTVAALDAAALTVLILATLPLWTGTSMFPAVPLVSPFLAMPLFVDRAALLALIVGCGWMLRRCLGKQPASLAPPAAMQAVSLGVLIILNQHRLQPWAWRQCLALFVLLGDGAQIPQRLRWLTLGVYVHSALSKFNYSFLLASSGYGPRLIGAAAAGLGLDFETASASTTITLAALLPLGELLIAALLTSRRFWRLGLVLSLVMHLGLAAVLGLVLGHAPGVVFWNLYFVVQNLLLWSDRALTDVNASGDESLAESPQSPRTLCARLAQVAVLLACVAPLGEPLRWIDPWPAWGLYSQHPAYAVLYVRDSAADALPTDVIEHLDKPDGEGWRVLRADAWSLDAVRAPIYPGPRFHFAVAAAVVERYLPEGGWAHRDVLSSEPI